MRVNAIKQLNEVSIKKSGSLQDFWLKNSLKNHSNKECVFFKF